MNMVKKSKLWPLNNAPGKHTKKIPRKCRGIFFILAKLTEYKPYATYWFFL